jgi:hypothetical protein
MGAELNRSSSDLLVFSDTGTVLAMGLANLIFGSISFFHKVSSNFFSLWVFCKVLFFSLYSKLLFHMFVRERLQQYLMNSQKNR